jgi:hypothetical protein
MGRGDRDPPGRVGRATGRLYFEFDVPRFGSRTDAVLVSGPAIFPIEFKCGERQFRLTDYNQAYDYDLDLKNFHAASHDAQIFPILVATQAEASDGGRQSAHRDGVQPPISLWRSPPAKRRPAGVRKEQRSFYR